MLVAVTIPVYKKDPNKFERISLEQALKVLGKYPIRFVVPIDLDVSYYQKATQNFPDVEFVKFENSFFKDINGYNQLMLNLDFYRTFEAYKYILVYQLDSFVFRDELKYWCSLNYDFIGAPWFQNVYGWLSSPKGYPVELKLFHKLFFKGKFLKRVGNGGFSLRKVSACINNLRLFQNTAKNWTAYEDSFYSHYLGTFNPFFRIPGQQKALKFSFDQLPEKAFQLNKFETPFGCHAWYHNNKIYPKNLDFWIEHIRKNNFDL